MKNQSNFASRYIAIIFLAIIQLLFTSKSLALDYDMISFSESFSTQGTTLNVGIQPKGIRLNKYGSDIVINHPELPDSVLKCVLFAKDIWESSINGSMPIVIDLEYNAIENDIETDVIYETSTEYAIPYALYRYHTQTPDSLADGIIRINSDINWNCSVENATDTGRPNLTFALLRSFAKILGFGSTIRIDNNEMLYWLKKRYYTIFDKNLISSDNKAICDFSLDRGKPNQQMTDFFNSKSRLFYILAEKNLYELEKTPGTDGSVLSYFKNDSSLMSFNPRKGAYYLRVDDWTRSVLRELGWNVKDRPAVEIVCDEAGDNGIMSAYSRHSFHIKSDNPASITNPQWSLSLPLADGGVEKLTLNGNGLSCTIPAIENEERYKINVNGDIYASLNFACQSNGTMIQAEPYRISLELKPKIEYVNIIKIIQHPELKTYDVHFEIKYYGSDELDVSVEEEYGTWQKNQYICEPFWTKCICKDITGPYSTWIDFFIRNDYGSDTYTVEFGPYGELVDAYRLHNDCASLENVRPAIGYELDYIEIYSGQGLYLGKYNCIEDARSYLKKGFYVIKEFYSNGTIKNIKQLIK